MDEVLSDEAVASNRTDPTVPSPSSTVDFTVVGQENSDILKSMEPDSSLLLDMEKAGYQS